MFMMRSQSTMDNWFRIPPPLRLFLPVSLETIERPLPLETIEGPLPVETIEWPLPLEISERPEAVSWATSLSDGRTIPKGAIRFSSSGDAAANNGFLVDTGPSESGVTSIGPCTWSLTRASGVSVGTASEAARTAAAATGGVTSRWVFCFWTRHAYHFWRSILTSPDSTRTPAPAFLRVA